MAVAEECLNRRPEPTFHKRVNLWQPLPFKLRRDASPVFLRLRQAPCDLRLARIEALAFHSFGVEVAFNHYSLAIRMPRRRLCVAVCRPHLFRHLCVERPPMAATARCHVQKPSKSSKGSMSVPSGATATSQLLSPKGLSAGTPSAQ